MRVIRYPFGEKDGDIIGRILIRNQGSVIYPTETFYALGCVAGSSKAVENIYRLKKRKKEQPLLVLVDDWAMLNEYAEEPSIEQRRFLESYWPGPLTAIMKSRNNLAKELNYSNSTLAFRMTSSEIARQLIRIVKMPLVGTSANLSSKGESNTVEQASQVFAGKIDLYVDGGPTPGKLPSTIVDITDSGHYRILRQGLLKINRNADG